MKTVGSKLLEEWNNLLFLHDMVKKFLHRFEGHLLLLVTEGNRTAPDLPHHLSHLMPLVPCKSLQFTTVSVRIL